MSAFRRATPRVGRAQIMPRVLVQQLCIYLVLKKKQKKNQGKQCVFYFIFHLDIGLDVFLAAAAAAAFEDKEEEEEEESFLLPSASSLATLVGSVGSDMSEKEEEEEEKESTEDLRLTELLPMLQKKKRSQQ